MGNGALAIGPKLPRPSSTLPCDTFYRLYLCVKPLTLWLSAFRAETSNEAARSHRASRRHGCGVANRLAFAEFSLGFHGSTFLFAVIVDAAASVQKPCLLRT